MTETTPSRSETFLNAPLIQRFASLLLALQNCRTSGNTEWEARHTTTLDNLARHLLPSGSGIDAGVTLDVLASTPERVVFRTSFHHINDEGMYDGWTDHQVIVTPSLAFGFKLRVTGRDRNEIKGYLAELFQDVLSRQDSALV